MTEELKIECCVHPIGRKVSKEEPMIECFTHPKIKHSAHPDVVKEMMDEIIDEAKSGSQFEDVMKLLNKNEHV